MSAASDAMKTLTEQWYIAVTTSLNLNQQQFQMVQGNVGLGSTSANLWSMMDTIPPYSITQYWTPGGLNTFSSQYGALISRLKDPSFGQFQHDMGNYYATWVAYLKATPPPAGQTIVQHFTSWAYSNIPDPQKAATVISEYAAAMNGPIAQANSAYFAAGGQTGVKAFTQSIEDVDYAANSAPSGGVDLDTSTQSSDTSHTWAKASASGFYGAFFGNVAASYDKQTSVVLASGLKIVVKYDHVATIPISQLSQGTKLSGPTTYQPWYVPAAMLLAYSNNNNNTWQVGTPDWTTFFGPTGTIPRIATNLLVVNGITLTITSSKSVAESSQTEVKTAFEAGFFPFFGINGEGGWSTHQTFDDAGKITATAACALGNPQVLGILQSPLSQFASAASMLEAMRATRSASGLGAAQGPFSFAAEVRSPTNVEATQVVSVAWTAVALQGLRNLGAAPAVENLIVGFVNNWATNNAPHWAVGSHHQYNGGPPWYTATAHVERDTAGTRVVNIVAFV